MPDALMSTYNRLPVSFSRGEGVWLWDKAEKRYLDALSGIAVCGLGHSPPGNQSSNLPAGGKSAAHLQSVPNSAAGAVGR